MSGADQPTWYSSTHSLWGAGAGRGAARRRSMPAWITISAPSACDAVRLADVSEAEPALDVQAGELGVRRTPTLRNRRATLDAEPGETEVHEIGAAAQQFADLGTAAMLIAVEPADLIVVDVAAGRDRFGATGAHRRRPASCAPSGVQLRTGPPEPGSTGGHRRTPSPASPRPVCQPLEASPPASHLRVPAVCTEPCAALASRAAPGHPRSADRNFSKGRPHSSHRIFAAAHPNHRAFRCRPRSDLVSE